MTKLKHVLHATAMKLALGGLVLGGFGATAAHADLVGNVSLTQSRFETMDVQRLTQMASGGNQHAQFFLAKRLQKGEDMPVDAANAVYWYTRAAEQNVAPAQLNLGIMYLRGEGVPADMQKGRAWLEKAAHLGDNRASYALAVLDEKNQRLVDAYKWYDLSARDAMLDDNVRNRARGKISQLALNLSSTEIQSAKDSANRWFQNQ